jgi:carbonic anhydrase/acetyltransferase-like protein (isoleucine patch superfamily)
MDNCVIESNSIVAAGAVITQIQLLLQVRFGQVFQPKKSKTLINLILLEKSNVSNNYVMYSGWFKDEE